MLADRKCGAIREQSSEDTKKTDEAEVKSE